MKTAKVFSVVLLVCASALVAEGKWTFTPSGTSTVAGTLTDGNWTFTLTGKSTGGVDGSEIASVTSGSGDLDLSDVYDETDIKLNSIYKSAFSGKAITSFKAGSYFRAIGNQVFMNCSDLQTVELNEGLTTLNYAAFKMGGRTCLSRVVLPSTLTTLGGECFSGTTNLTEIVPFLPASVSNFQGNDTFYKCAVRGRLSLTNSVLKDLKSQAFYGCYGIKEVDLGDNITSMSSAFAACSGLTNLVSGLPSALKSGYKAFASCSSLACEMDFSSCTNMFSLSDEMFNGASAITSVILPPRVTNICYRAFRNCSNLRTVKASDPGVWRAEMKAADGIVGKHAFNNSQKIGSVQIPWGGRTSFGTELPFGNNFALTNIWFFGKAPAADCMDFLTSGPAAYKCVLDVSKQADEAGWRALGRDLTEAEKAKADKPEGRVFGIVEKPAGREAWLRWKASPLYPSGLILLMR